MTKENAMIDMAREYLMEVWCVQDETIDCMVAVNGWSMETMESILYWVAGYHHFDQTDDWEEWEEGI